MQRNSNERSGNRGDTAEDAQPTDGETYFFHSLLVDVISFTLAVGRDPFSREEQQRSPHTKRKDEA